MSLPSTTSGLRRRPYVSTVAAALEAEGAHPFTYSTKAGASVSLGFWSLPGAALDDAETATAWARRSLDVALKKAAEKKPRKPRSR